MSKALALRAQVTRDAQEFFASRGFLQVETPALVPCPGLDVHLDAFETKTSHAARYLATSPEYQMKRLLGDGYNRIFQISKVFRRGELGARHNPEFTMLEWYRAPGTQADTMSDTEQLVARVTSGRVLLGQRAVCTLPPFERLPLRVAFERFASIGEAEFFEMADSDEDTFFRILVDEVEPAIAEFNRAVFLTEYPSTQASLARKDPRDPRVAERYELYVAGLELCNGFGELTDADEQRTRFEADQHERRARGLDVYPLDEKFLSALERGLPACSGNALGLDRLAALVAGSTDIGAILSFSADEL